MAEQSHPVRRRVAVKLIREGRDSRTVLARFDAERQALAMMDHPHIAKVLDAGSTSEGRPYFVMELVRGVPITEYCDGSQLTPQQRVELFIPVCEAVQHAHQKGIIHRDLKPSNILVGLVDQKPVPKVIDFGVAKALHQRLTDKTMVTEVGAIVGTLEYMAPEQAELSNLDIDTRADIYALGVVLYELLTGTPPFTAQELRSTSYAEMLRIIREVEPHRPSTKVSTSTQMRTVAARRKLDPRRLTREIHGDLDWIVMRCLEKDRARRYETANGLASDLRRYLAHEPVSAGPPRLSYRVKKWVRRRPAGAALVGMIALVPVLVSVLLLWHARRVEGMNARIQAESENTAREARAARAAEHQERVQRDLAEGRERISQRHLYAANIGLFPRVWESGRPIGLYELLEGTRPERTGGQDLRGWEWFHLHQLAYPEAVRFRGHTTPIQAVAFSPDGERVATTGTDGVVLVWDPQTGAEIRRIGVSESVVLALAFSPDGTRLAVACQDATAGVLDVQSGRRLFRLDGHALAVNHIAFSPDGRLLATGSEDNFVKLWDGTTGKPAATLYGHQAGIGRLWFHEDGTRLASLGGDRTLRYWSVPDGREAAAAVVLPSSLGGLSPDFALLARVGADRRSVSLVELATDTVRAELFELDRVYRDVTFSADGRKVLTADADGDLMVWDARTGNPVRRQRGWAETVTPSPDGNRVACACSDHTVKIWDTTGRGPLLSGTHYGSTRRVAVSPNGQLLATGDSTGSISLWDARTGERRRILGLHLPEYGPPGSPPNPARARLGERGLRHTVQFSPPAGGKYLPGSLREVHVYEGHGNEITGLAFSPDGKTLASTGNLEARLWDVQTGNETRVLRHPLWTSSMAFSPDGTRLVTGCWDDQVRVWNVRSGVEEVVLKGHDDNVDAVLFHPSGKRLISAGLDAIIRVWDLTSRTVVKELKGHTGSIHVLALSPDGRILASGAGDETVRVWDVQSGAMLHTLHGHTARVTALQFLPDMDRLASASSSPADDRVRVWDLKIGREIVALGAPRSYVHGMAFDTSGHRLLLTAGRTVVGWEITDPAEANPLPEVNPRTRRPPPQFTTDFGPRVLGYFRTKSLFRVFSSKTEITPETNGNEFLVVVLSVPYDGLYPSPREHERIQERHRLDPDENPAAPAQSYALFVPSRFGLVTADGSRRPAAALAPYFTYRDGRLEYCPGPTVQSSTSTLDPRDRTLIAAAWEVGPEDAPDRFRVRFERWEPLAIPDLRLDEYRGDPTSGSAARRAGQGRGRGSLQVTRNYSEY